MLADIYLDSWIFFKSRSLLILQQALLQIAVVGSIGMLGCNPKNKIGTIESKEPTLPNEKSITLPASNMTVGYLAESRYFSSSRTGGQSWANIVADIKETGNIQVRFDKSALDSIEKVFDNYYFYDKEGGKVRAFLTRPDGQSIVSNGESNATELVIEAPFFVYQPTKSKGVETKEQIMNFVNDLGDTYINAEASKFVGLDNGKTVTLLTLKKN